MGAVSGAGDSAFVLGFLGFGGGGMAGAAAAFEDEVLALLGDHGARLIYRGRRAEGEDPALPLEVHVIWFPGQESFEAYLADERRLAAIEEHGEVFDRKEIVRLDTVVGPDRP